jgi:SOS-response transcriptional repressor LexA
MGEGVAAPEAVETKRGEYLVVEADVPGGQGPVAVGVLLYDSASHRLGVKLRRDWEQVAGEDEWEFFDHLAEDWEQRADVDGAGLLHQLEDSVSNAIRVSERRQVLMADFKKTLNRLYRQEVQPAILRYQTHLPVYSLQAAAGKWGPDQGPAGSGEPEGWIEAPPDLALSKDMFVAQVVGRSMEPVIPDRAMCVFRTNIAGSRHGKRVLVENLSEFEQRYTVKRYSSLKQASESGEWRHARIRLEPLNPEFEAWELEEGAECRVIGEFVRVLDEA